MLLSVCMIVRNGEPYLDAALASVRAFADQIVCVDTGSTDGSVAVARRHGADVHFFTWIDDFAAARNASLGPARGDWILQLDADHVYQLDDGFDLRAFLAAAPQLGFLIREEVGRQGVRNYLDRLLLFRNVPGLRYEGIVHEHPMHSLKAYAEQAGMEQPVAFLPALRVLHQGYEEEAPAKLARNLRLLRKAVRTAPHDLHYRYKLLLTLKAVEDDGYEAALREAVPAALQAVQAGAVDLPAVGILGLIGEAVDGGAVEATASFREALEAAGAAVAWADVRVTLPAARLARADGRLETATRRLEQCLEAGLAFTTAPAPIDRKTEAVALLVRCYVDARADARLLHLLRILPDLSGRLGLDLEAVFRHLEQQDPPAFAYLTALLGA